MWGADRQVARNEAVGLPIVAKLSQVSAAGSGIDRRVVDNHGLDGRGADIALRFHGDGVRR